MAETPLEVKRERALYMRKYTSEVESPEIREARLQKRRNKFKELRLKVLELLGNRCNSCGFADERALQIDHVNGGGQADRRERGYNSGYPYTFFTKIMADPEFKEKYQVLCANCNWIKRRERKEFNQGVGSKPRKYLN